jgi:hypothetical protein
VVYETTGWTNRRRARLTESLLDAKVSHRWNGSELRVTRRYEKTVDRMMAERR